MTAKIIDGIAIANEIKQEIKKEIEDTKTTPTLAVILVGNDSASKIYISKKEIACSEVGIRTKQLTFPEITQSKLIGWLSYLSYDDKETNGILVQLPLPSDIDKFAIFDAIAPIKDVDVFSAYNTGMMIQNRSLFSPCTPQAVKEALIRSNIPIHGQHVVIINRSLIVGQPLAHMLMQNGEFANATVTVCHEYTKNIKDICKSADIIVSAVGKPKDFKLTADMVKPGATVIDVAIIREKDRIFGDVDFEEVRKVAGYITPVPGGIGPLTVAMLLKNTLQAALLQKKYHPIY